MRSSRVAIAALMFTFGCSRFGYEDQPRDRSKRDAAPADGSAPERDAGAAHDAGATDPGAAGDAGEAGTVGPSDGGDIDDDSGESDPRPPDLCPERQDAVFCDGFEDPKLARWNYTVVENGTLSRTTDRVRTGEASLRATSGAAPTDGGNNEARYGAVPFDHRRSGDLWVRSYYYLPSSTVVTAGFSTVVINEIEPPYFGFALRILPNRVEIGASGNRKFQGSIAFPRDRWVCVELHVKIDDDEGVFEAYLDRSLAVRSSATDTIPEMGYTSLDVGIHYTETSQGPVEVYVDDVAAGFRRVACD